MLIALVVAAQAAPPPTDEPEEVVVPEAPPRKPRIEREPEPGYLLFRGGPIFDLEAHTLDGEEVTRFSGYTLGYGYGIRHFAMDFQYRHDGWSVAEAPDAAIEMRTHRFEAGIAVDLLGFSSELVFHPSLGPYAAIGLGMGRHTRITELDGSVDRQLLAVGLVYGARAGLGVRVSRDFLLEASVRAGRSPYAWGLDSTPLDYGFSRGWELHAALAIGVQAD